MPRGPAREHIRRFEWGSGQQSGEEQLVVDVVRLDATEQIAAHAPWRASASIHHTGRRSPAAGTTAVGELQAGPHRSDLGERQVGAFELAGRGQDVGCERGELALHHVDHHERVELPQRGAHALRLRERGDRIAAGDDEAADVAGLDLVGQRDGRHLPDDPRQLRPAHRPFHLPPPWPPRSLRM